MKPSDPPAGIFVVTGARHSGKTTYVASVARELKDRGVHAGGFLCPGEFRGGIRSSFDLEILPGGKRISLASDRGDPRWPRTGRFRFDPDAVSVGNEALYNAVRECNPVIIIDEVGPLELEGGGWSPGLDKVVENHSGVQVWVVRETLIRQVTSRWRFTPEAVVMADAGSESVLTEKIAERCRKP